LALEESENVMNERRQSRVAQAILDYLREHPEAQDTLAGIAEWWLPVQGIKDQNTSVKEALDELVAEGLISELRGSDTQISYRITQRGLQEAENTLTQ
jgi:DNA-binding PadR family transcriptional regulator